MKYLSLFENYKSDSDIKELYDNVVKIISNDKFTQDERRVVFKREDGSEDTYIGTMEDIKNDFKETNKKFVTYIPKKKKVNKKTQKYNLIYTKSKSKHEILERDILYPVAVKLKNNYSMSNNYQKGKLKISKNK